MSRSVQIPIAIIGMCCHHAGILRPSRHLPLPFSGFSENNRLCAETDTTKRNMKTDAFFRVSSTLTLDHGQGLETVEKIKVLEGSGDSSHMMLPYRARFTFIRKLMIESGRGMVLE